MADEQIIVEFIAQTSDAVANAEQWREALENLKKTILETTTTSKVSIKDLETAWVKSVQKMKAEQIAQIKTGVEGGKIIPKEDIPDRIRGIKDYYDKFIALGKAAFKEAASDQKKYFDEQAAIVKQSYKQQEAEAKASAKAQADAAKNMAALQKEQIKNVEVETKNQYKESAQYAAEYTRITQQGYGVMSVGAQTYGAQVQAVKTQIQQLSAQSGQSFQQVAQQLQAAGVPIPMINQALGQLNQQMNATSQGFKLFGQSISTLGDLARVVFLGLFGVSVVSILRNVVRGLEEATKAGFEFAKAIFQLEVGARALQRAGVDITIKQIYDQLGTLQDRFKIFTTKDLVVGTAAFLNLNRDMGFTREQLFKLQDAIATLAIVNGRSMDEVQRTVALALSSGYTEGLQRLGVSINRVTIANEAARLGYAKNYMSLTEVQRAAATYNLVIEKTAIYEKDLQKYFETAPGAIDRTKTSFQELKNQIGLLIATNFGLYLKDINRLLDNLNREIEAAKLRPMAQAILHVVEKVKELNKELSDTQKWVKDILTWMIKFTTIKAFPSPFNNILATLDRLLYVKSQLDEGILGDEVANDTERQADKIRETVGDALGDLEEFEKNYGEKIQDIMLDYQRDIEKLERDAARRRVELARDLQRDLANIEREGAQKRADLQRDYFRKLQQIDAELARDIAQENSKYAMDVAQAVRAAAQRRAELEARYRENEIKAELRFQEEMQRLREGFLLDLEDALHERDARQVLRLIRQYNLQKTQAERQYDIERDERKRAFELELKELEIQRQERLRILAEEHAARLAALQEQAAYEKQLAAQKYEEDKAELARRLEEEKADRIAKALEAERELEEKLKQAQEDRKLLLGQQIADLNAERDRILQEIGEKLWGALQITTEEGLKTLYQALLDTLGPEGDADKVFGYYAESAQRAAIEVEGSLTRVTAMMAQLYAFIRGLQGFEASIPSVPGGGGSSTTPTPSPTGGNPRQSGGSVQAGQRYKVAENDFEVFSKPGTFIPDVGGQVYNKNQFLDLINRNVSRGEGQIRIGVSLSEGLVGKIIEDSLDQVADVVFELERRRK